MTHNFRRSIGKNMFCRFENRCDLYLDNRKNCAACRFKKCKEIGMEINLVHGKDPPAASSQPSSENPPSQGTSDGASSNSSSPTGDGESELVRRVFFESEEPGSIDSAITMTFTIEETVLLKKISQSRICMNESLSYPDDHYIPRLIHCLKTGNKIHHSMDDIIFLGNDYMTKVSLFITKIAELFFTSKSLIEKILKNNIAIFINLQNAIFFYGTFKSQTYQEQIREAGVTNAYLEQALEDEAGDLCLPRVGPESFRNFQWTATPDRELEYCDLMRAIGEFLGSNPERISAFLLLATFLLLDGELTDLTEKERKYLRTCKSHAELTLNRFLKSNIGFKKSTSATFKYVDLIEQLRQLTDSAG